jgi:hypothetical protein
MRRLILIPLVLVAGCARNVKPDGHTGDDGVYKGAHAITLTAPTAGSSVSTGEAEGVVSYPGGDRVDWKLIEIPADHNGRLELELSWRSPRPGLDLAFKVYSQWGEVIAEAEPKKHPSTKKKHPRKTAAAKNVKGKVYVLVYASRRVDAGEYELTATFHDETRIIVQTEVPIPQPPRLAIVTPPATVVPPPPPPPPQACPDPKKPDAAIADCVQYFEDCDVYQVDNANPKCDGVKQLPFPPVQVELSIEKAVSGGKVEITIPLGSDDGIEAGQLAALVDGSGNEIEGGGFTIVTVNKRTAMGRVKLPEKVVRDNRSVLVWVPYKKKLP